MKPSKKIGNLLSRDDKILRQKCKVQVWNLYSPLSHCWVLHTLRWGGQYKLLCRHRHHHSIQDDNTLPVQVLIRTLLNVKYDIYCRHMIVFLASRQNPQPPDRTWQPLYAGQVTTALARGDPSSHSSAACLQISSPLCKYPCRVCNYNACLETITFHL